MITLNRGNDVPIELNKIRDDYLKIINSINEKERYNFLKNYKHFGEWNTKETKKLFSLINKNRCSFCTKYILEFSRSMEIEHIELKSKVPEKAFDWDNLLCSCKQCNQCRGKQEYDKNLYIDPTMEDNVEKYFIFHIDGTISENFRLNTVEQDKAKYMIKTYKLCRKELIYERRKFIKDIYRIKYFSFFKENYNYITFLNVWKYYERRIPYGKENI